MKKKLTLSNTNNSRINAERLRAFQRQNELSRQVMQENRLAGRHFLEYQGDTFEIDSNVFSPKVFFDGFHTFIQGMKQNKLEGKTFLEIGTGCGIVALHLLKQSNLREVTMTDIQREAIDCAKRNADNLGLTEQCKFLVSDIFDNVNILEKKYDIIFWNYPWLPEADNYVFVDDLDRSLFDPGYQLIERYISESKKYINQNGKIYLGFGDFGYWDMLDVICSRHSVIPIVAYENKGIEGDTVTYQLIEITPSKRDML